jgi:hypothetical protein
LKLLFPSYWLFLLQTHLALFSDAAEINDHAKGYLWRAFVVQTGCESKLPSG